MAPRAVEEIGNKINEYIQQNGTQIKSACRGSVEVLWDDESLKNRILAIFNTIAFDGLSLQELIDKLSAPIEIDSARIKRILGFLIQEGTLEYIDFRCYRVYPKFEDYLTSCDDIEPRNKEIIGKRLRGDTLEEIAQEYDERILPYVERAWQEDDIMNLMDDEYMGYTLVTLSVALWAFWHSTSFTEGLLKVVNAGGDADTNAAVACAILGAKYGFGAIPKEYVDGLIYNSQLEKVVESLTQLCIKE